MAISRNNVITFGLSGKVGDILVFRQKDGQTIVAKAPRQSGKLSEKQKEHRKRFQQAVIYAKAATESSETAELYKAVAAKRKQNPINVAVADFFNAPDIDHVDLSGYAGAAGELIIVGATDDFAVKSVHIKIVNADGTVEEGAAVQNGARWHYTTIAENNSIETSKIVVSVSDIPGNLTEQEFEKQ
ncbi:MAG: hypothetical protein LBC98_07625 [Prevotellaceae bacterium]|jgi:hypothetical protein|nr:hypothetical protein [Prevotellaceae bacterium]